MNEELNIRVTVPGVVTIGDLANEIKRAKTELKGLGVASVEAGQKQKYIESLTKVYRTHTHVSSEFSKLIREERQEQRQVNFALREGIGAMSAMGLQGKVLNEVLGGSVSAFSGMSFAIKALNPSLAALALPIGAIATAFFLFNKILSDSKKLTNDLNDGLIEQAKLMREAGFATTELLRKRLQMKLGEAQEKFANAGGGISWESYVGFASEGRAGIKKAWRKEQVDAENEVWRIVNQIKQLDKEDADEKQRILDITAETEKKIKSLSKLMKDDRADAVRKAQEAESKRYNEAFTRTGSLQANSGNVVPINVVPSIIPSVQTSGAGPNIGIAMRQFSAELRDSSEVIYGFKSAMWGVTDSLTRSFMGLLQGTNGLIGVFTDFGNAVLQMLVEMGAQQVAKTAVGGILSLFGLANGGDVSVGGGLKFAAGGGNFKYGKTQNVVVGERSPELMTVGRNGVRITPLGGVNRSGMAGRFGSVDMFHVSVHPIIDNQGLAMQVIIGNNQRNKRIMRAK